jgi:hypothetical protein
VADRPGAESLTSRLGVLDGPVDPRPEFAERLFAELSGVSPVSRLEGSVHPLDPIRSGSPPEADAGFPSPLGGGVAP